MILCRELEGLCKAAASKVRQNATEEKNWQEEIQLIKCHSIAITGTVI
jgi:hypothetical protein